MTYRSCWRTVPFLALVLTVLAGASLSAQSPPFLFLEEDPDPLSSTNDPLKKELAHSRRARVDPTVLAQLHANGTKDVSCRIKFDRQSEQTFRINKRKTSDERYQVFAGNVQGQTEGQIIFVTDGRYLAGSAQIGGRTFQIKPKPNGICELTEPPMPKGPWCGIAPGSLKDVTREVPGRRTQAKATAQAINVAPLSDSMDLREIEVMMLYTTGSREIAGDVAAMETEIRLSIEEANSALANSDAGVRFRIVHTAEIAYIGSGDLALDLQRLWSATGDNMTEVRGWRDQYKADLVCLVVERWQTSIGVGYFATGPDDGYSVVAMEYLTGSYNVAHELGHNLGCDHDRDNATGGGAFPFSYGYRFDAGGTTYRTVMAYYPGKMAPYYSSPTITLEGVPIGRPDDAADAADNARTIREMAAYVDSYRGLDIVLTQPATGESSRAEASVEISATVNSDEGPVENVEFLDGDSLLGEVSTAPYLFSWTSPVPGRHEIFARTHIAGGRDILSSPVIIGVGPGNDNFADRALLSGSNSVASVILYAATSEPGEPASIRSAGASAWWKWSAPQDGVVRVSLSGTPVVKSLVSIFSGTTLDQLQSIPTSRTSMRDLLFRAVAGTEYEICVAGEASSDPLSLYLTMQDPPANDAFTQAQPIDVATGKIQGSTVAATTEPGEPLIGATPLGHSVWFFWTPPFSGRATVMLDADMGRADLAIFTGTALNDLTLLANSNDARDGFAVQAQRKYYIAVEGDFQPINLSLNIIKPAVNDNFAKRSPASPVSALFALDPATTTREPGEPLHGTLGGGHSAWWKWTAASRGGIRLMPWPSAAPGVPPNVSVAVYSGNALTNLTRVAACDFTNRIQDPLLVPVLVGTNYAIAVESGAGPIQTVQFDFQVLRYDNFKQRSVYASASSGTTLGATAEPGEPDHGGEPAVHSVWWSWPAIWGTPSIRTVAINVDGMGDTLPRVSVYSGDILSNLTLIAENTVAGESGPSVVFAAKSGARYNFAIDEGTSSFGYSISVQGVTAPQNDRFSSALALSSQSQSMSGSTVGATLEPGEPEHLPSAAVVSGSVWYIWPSSTERDITILAQGRRANSAMRAILPEPVVAVYHGTSLSSLTNVVSDIGSVTFRTSRNTQYYIAVGSRAALAQDFTLSILDVPANDSFAHARALSGNDTVSPVQIRSATREAGEPNHAGQASGHSLWWRWTAPDSGEYVWSNPFNSTATQPLALITAVYRGTSLNDLTVIASNTWSTVRFPAEVGKQYYLALDLADPRIAFSAGSGQTFRLSLFRYPALLSASLNLDSSIEFGIGGSAGQLLSVETSSDFIHWEPARQLNMSRSTYRYSEPSSLLVPRKFFRLHLLQSAGMGFEQ